ncbi:MAG: restriction endonuclease [Chloroflexi bacterium]|nr:restriction endonuclease [Chloroflexota bacterium]
MKPARVYPARGSRITPTTIHPFPLPTQVSTEMRGGSFSVILLSGAHLGITPVQAAIVPSEPSQISPGLADARRIESLAVELDQPQVMGCACRATPTAFGDGPPPLSQSGRSGREQSQTQVSGPGPRIELLLPFLEPSVLNAQTAQLVLPGELRGYQIEAVNALLARDAFLLADDPGTGKTVSACVALMAKFQNGEIHRALYVCNKSGLRQTAGFLAQWAPGLLVRVIQGDPELRKRQWNAQAHVYLVDYETLTAEIEQEHLTGDLLQYDLILLDQIQTTGLRYRSFPGAYQRLDAPIRWALAGAFPKEAEDWVGLFAFLTPDQVSGAAGITLPDIRRRFRPYILRREKDELKDDLPKRTRQEIWVDLDDVQTRRYENVLAEERYRLAQLGDAVSTSHIETAVDRLKRASNFAPESLGGAKVRALIDLVEQIAAADLKMVVFSQFSEGGVDLLQPVLEPYGVLKLGKAAPEEQRAKVLDAFRAQEHWHVLLLEMGTRTGDDALVEATYIVHFDHQWNPAVRLRAEMRLHPQIFRAIPLNIYEFWVTGTIDERIYALLAEKGLLPSDVPEETRPTELEGRISLDEWLHRILGTPSGKEPERTPVKHPIGTGILPGTAILRDRLAELSPDTLNAAVETFIKALGYAEIEPLDEGEEGGSYLLAWRESEGEVERVLVRSMSTHKNVGIAKARALLKAMEIRRDCEGAYLITTSDFTSSCRKFADDSDGRLALVSGSELYRHLHILGQF